MSYEIIFEDELVMPKVSVSYARNEIKVTRGKDFLTGRAFFTKGEKQAMQQQAWDLIAKDEEGNFIKDGDSYKMDLEKARGVNKDIEVLQTMLKTWSGKGDLPTDIDSADNSGLIDLYEAFMFAVDAVNNPKVSEEEKK